MLTYYSSTNKAAISNPLIAQSNDFGCKIVIAGRIFAIEKVGWAVENAALLKQNKDRSWVTGGHQLTGVFTKRRRMFTEVRLICV